MQNDRHRAIMVIGREEPGEAAFDRALRYDDVYVVARAVVDPSDRWVTDDDRDRASAYARLGRVLACLRMRGVHAAGEVGDPDAGAALSDARSRFPDAGAVFV